MGRVWLTRAGWSRAGVLTGGAMATSGAGLGLGLAVGLVVGGMLLVAYCLLLAETDPEKDGGGP